VSDPRLLLSNPQSIVGPNPPRFLGRQLVEDGQITAIDLVHALDLQSKIDAQLGEILIAEGLIDTNTLLDALAVQSNAQRVDIKRDPPRLNMAEALPAAACLQHEVVPWLWIGNTLLVATSNPNQFEHLRVSMGKTQLSMLPVIADANQIRAAITRIYGYQLAQKAITQVPNRESCRNWGTSNLLKSKWAIVLGGSAITGIVLFPLLALTLLVLWAALTLALTARPTPLRSWWPKSETACFAHRSGWSLNSTRARPMSRAGLRR